MSSLRSSRLRAPERRAAWLPATMTKFREAVAMRRDQLKAQPDFMPSLLKIIAAGQKPVKDAWIRLRPIKAASSSQ